MARSGTFSAPNFALQAPLGLVKPLDNRIPIFDAALVGLKASLATKQDLQAQIDELVAAMTLARDYSGF